MRLSDAIWLGDSLKRPDAFEWLRTDGSCGCALGGALLASGISGEQFNKEYYSQHGKSGYDAFTELPSIEARWPWLTSDHVMTISSMYCRVQQREMSLAQLCDYVRSIEPAEPEYEPEEEYWTDSKGMAEMVNSIKGR